MENKLKIISIVIFLTSFLNFSFSQIVVEEYDTLAFRIDKNFTFPYISNKKELYKLYGKPIQKSKHLYITMKDNKKATYKSIHYMWNTIYYVEIRKTFFITSINMLDGDYNICFNNFSVNSKTNIEEIAMLFPNSYKNRIVYPKEFSSYYPDKLVDDLTYVIIVIPDGYLDLFFYKNNIFYINFRFNDIDNILNKKQ